MKGKMKEGCKRASGGSVKPYDAQGSNVEKEAEERKKGGRVKKADHKVEGEKAKRRLDRPHRASGGRVGSDKSPFTSAKADESAKAHKTDSGGSMG